jgi:hypothetical protein
MKKKEYCRILYDLHAETRNWNPASSIQHPGSKSEYPATGKV